MTYNDISNVATTVKMLRRLADRVEQHKGPGMSCEWSHAAPPPGPDQLYLDIPGVSGVEIFECRIVFSPKPTNTHGDLNEAG